VLKKKGVIRGVLERGEQKIHYKRRKGEIVYDQDLFELLRKKRKELADAGHVPPYVVFSDQTLAEMAAYFPMRPESFLKINGVGQVKAERYGALFIDVISAYCQEHDLSEEKKPGKESPSAHRQSDDLGKTAIVAGAFQDGQSVSTLMNRFSVSQGTILDHLLHYMQAGNKLRKCDDLLELSGLTPERQDQVITAFVELGADRLRPVFDRFNGTINYEELKLLKIYCTSLVNDNLLK
jgi:ATP-dependent DNA helicase RecQ